MHSFVVRSFVVAIAALVPTVAQAGSPIFSNIADFGGDALEGKSFFEAG